MAEVSLERLVDVRPTASIVADLEAHRTNLGRLHQSERVVRARAEEVIAILEQQLALAQRRDAIHAERPPGCWCLGLGGWGARYVPTMDGSDFGAERVWERYCTCPEALEAGARADVAVAHFKANRRAHRTREMFECAEVPPRLAGFSFDTYPICDATRDAVARVRVWAETDDERSLLLYGPFGVGKSGLAVAALRRRIEVSTTDALFITTPGLLDRIRATYGHARKRADGDDEPSEEDVLACVREAGLLVLDDLGAERPTGWVQEKLFSIVNDRYDGERPCIWTSNLSPEQLAKHLGERTAWRIVEMSEVVKLDGPNLRDRKAGA